MDDVLGELTPLGYGAANLGNLHRPMSDDEAWSVLETAWSMGIRYFDTAPHYGLGLSEQRLGAFLRSKPRDQYVVSTKVGRRLRENPEGAGGLDLDNDFHVPTTSARYWDFSGDGIRASLDESLERLGLDRVDIVYLHDPERFDLDQALDSALPALEELKRTGDVAAIGVGSMVNDAIEASLASAQLDIVMVAGRYTLLDPSAAERVLPLCRERSTIVAAAAPFNSGILAQERPLQDGRFDYGELPDPLRERLREILDICARHRVSLPSAAVQFPLRHPAVQTVVVGASRPSHLERAADWIGEPIPEGFWNDIDEAVQTHAHGN